MGANAHHGDLLTRGVGAFPASFQSTRTGNGYWIVDENGEVHAFGDARFAGDMRQVALDMPIRRLEASAQTGGYWLVAADGGVFSFGVDFYGSTGGMNLNESVISFERHTYRRWLLARGFRWRSLYVRRRGIPRIDWVTTSCGASNRHGGQTRRLVLALRARRRSLQLWSNRSTAAFPGLGLCSLPSTVAMRVTPTGRGYWLAASDGRVFAHGDAAIHERPQLANGQRIIDMAVSSG